MDFKSITFLKKFFDCLDRWGLVRRDPFGNPIGMKRIIVFVLGWLTYARLSIYNKTEIKGTEKIQDLPREGVLFLSNHQTYFMDVICLYHIFFSVKWRINNSIRFPFYLFGPRSRLFYVAASETMKEDGFLPRVFSLEAQDKVSKGLAFGWVVSFPQGTTRPFAPIRKGTAYLIKAANPIVVPVQINGFRRAFDKKGFFLKKRNTTLSVEFKDPIRFKESDTIEEILQRISDETGIPMVDTNAN